MKQKKNRTTNHSVKASLRRWVIGLAVLCVLAPLAVSGIQLFINYSGGVDTQLHATLGIQASGTANAIYRRINDVIALSADKTAVDNLSAIALLQDDRERVTREYMESLYGFRQDTVRAAYLVFTDEPGKTLAPASSAETSATVYSPSSSRRAFDSAIRENALVLAESSDRKAGFINEDRQLYLVRGYYRDLNETKPYAVLTLLLNTDFIYEENAASGLSIYEQRIWLGDILLSLIAPQQSAVLDERHFPTTSDQVEMSADGGRLLTFYVTEPGSALYFRYAVAIDVSASRAVFIRMVVIWAVEGLLLIPLVFYIIWHFRKHISRPSAALEHGLRELEAGRLGTVVEPAGRYRDTGSLIAAFNDMSGVIEDLFNRVYVEKLARRDARINALQSRINPEFLNNTLEQINWQANMAGDTEVSETITALSTLLDRTLNRGDEPVIALAEDMVTINAYMLIARKRFGGQLQFIRELGEGTENLSVPVNVISPLVENSVEHGIAPVGHGNIILRTAIEGEGPDAALIVEVINDGKKLTAEAIQRMNHLLQNKWDKEDSDGDENDTDSIHSIQERIKLQCGDAYGLDLSRDDQGMTVSRLTLPILHP